MIQRPHKKSNSKMEWPRPPPLDGKFHHVFTFFNLKPSLNVWAILYSCDTNQPVTRHNAMTLNTPVFLHNIFAWRQLNVRIYRFTPNLDRTESWLADTDPHHVMYLETFVENNIYRMSQCLNASMRVIKSSRPWLQVSNSVFHRRLEYLSNLKS